MREPKLISFYADTDSVKVIYEVESLIDSMYISMEYIERHIHDITFSELYDLMSITDKQYCALKSYKKRTSKCNSVLVKWYNLKKRINTELMNSRVILC